MQCDLQPEATSFMSSLRRRFQIFDHNLLPSTVSDRSQRTPCRVQLIVNNDGFLTLRAGANKAVSAGVKIDGIIDGNNGRQAECHPSAPLMLTFKIAAIILRLPTMRQPLP